jgi:Bacterial Ig-like domain
MNTRTPSLPLATCAAAVFALALAGCGGGSGEAPPQQPGAVVDAAAPVVTITNNVSAETATGPITFTFSFNRDVGTSFTADDVAVTGGTKGAFTRLSGTSATLVVTPAAGATGTVQVAVAAGSVTAATGTANAAVSASKAFNTVAPPPPPPATGTVVLANFDDVTPTVAGFEGAEGSAIETGPAGGGAGRSFKLLRSGGQVFALGIIETAVPVTATRRTVSAQVYSPTAGIPMIMKLEGPGGANTGDVAADQAVVVGWQTLTWTFTTADPSRTYNKIVLLPNLGTVDAPPGKAYFFDTINLQEAAPPPPAAGTVLANFDDVSPPVAGFEGAEGSAIEPGPAGGGSGNSFKVLRSGGQVFALGIIETTVPITATRRTVTAQVYSPTAGIPMILKLEGPGGANTGDVAANETVVAGWQTLSWTFASADPTRTYNKIVLLPNLGTVDAPPGKAYFFDAMTLGDAPPPPPATGTVLANFDDVTPPVAGFEGAEGSAIEPGPAGGGSGNSFKVLRSGGQVFALGIIETTVPVSATRRTVSAQVFSPTAGIPMILKLEGPGGANTGDVTANEAVVVGWQTLTWTFASADPSRTYNKIVLLPNLGTVDAPPGKSYFFDSITLLGAAGAGGGGGGGGTFAGGIFASDYSGNLGAGTAKSDKNGSVGFFVDPRLFAIKVFEDGGVAGSTVNPGGVPSFYYGIGKPATPTYADAYFGAFVNAPSNTTADASAFSKIKLRFWGDAESWEKPNFTAQVDVILQGPTNAACGNSAGRPELTRTVAAQKIGAGSEYIIAKSEFVLTANCGGAFTVDNVWSAIGAVVVRLAGSSNLNYVNLTPSTPPSYPTFINVGPISFIN